MSDRTKVFTVAHIAADLEQAWLQHLRDFDTANPDCHFEVIAEAPDATLSEMVGMLQVNPGLSVMQVISRKAPSTSREDVIKAVIALLPDSKATALDILDAARRIVMRFKKNVSGRATD